MHLSLLEIILESQPDNIDSLYLAAVCSRYLKDLMNRNNILKDCWLMLQIWGALIKSLGHLNRDMGNEDKAVMHYRQALSLILRC